ncbi:MAG: type 2 lanthipeptide synthetase LanM family protein [candidate division WOR-3 bacterium]
MPEWLIKVISAFTQPDFRKSLPSTNEKALNSKLYGFLNIIKPLLNRLYYDLNTEIRSIANKYSAVPFDVNNVGNILLSNLLDSLLLIMTRTMVLEVNIARLQGLLKGNKPEERFDNFIDRLTKQDVAIAILKKYPVLMRQITIMISNWVRCSIEFLKHLCDDWDIIREVFFVKNASDMLTHVNSSMSDKHQSGHSVIIAKFRSGFQIVYKPRSLAVDVHFQELLSWFNQNGCQPQFRILKIINRGNHGWVEFVKHVECSSHEEVQRFYERVGQHLAILYALEATDFHFENVIASGEYPIFVDLESLFQARPDALDSENSDLHPAKFLTNSVLRIGFLPLRLWSKEDYVGIDLSGADAREEQYWPDFLPYLEGIGTDEIKVVRKRVQIKSGQNRPFLKNFKINILDFIEQVIAGFTNMYKFLMDFRNDLLQEQGPLSHFVGDEVRIILRSTRTYWLLLNESFHPDLLRDGIERDIFFEKLWIGVEDRPYLEKVIASENVDLYNGDIPIFKNHIGSRDIICSSGKVIADFFNETGIDLVKRRLQLLSEPDLINQIWIIRASCAILDNVATPSHQQHYRLEEPLIIPEPNVLFDKLIEVARAVGDRIDMQALKNSKNISWLGLVYTNNNVWELSPLGLDLYDGLPGIVFFLAYLANITKQEKYYTLAHNALSSLRYQIRLAKQQIKHIGVFSGWGGLIYTFAHLGVLWKDPELLDEAKSYTEYLYALIEKDKQFDLIGGAAGCIASLLCLFHTMHSEDILSLAVQCGDRLLKSAVRVEHGIGWLVPFGGDKPLAGLSHGNAGIAWVLEELFAITGEKRFHLAALAAIEYERSLFSVVDENWLDIRKRLDLNKENNSQNNFMVAWCNGASGIGLARLQMLRYFENKDIRQEINTALKTTLNKGFGLNHSLCHGDLGNLELLLQACEILNEPYWKLQLNRLTNMILQSIIRYGWQCGVPLAIETPGLMTGLAGIGYGLLRIADPAHIPAILIVAPPKC